MSFVQKPISKKELKRLRRVKKRERERARDGNAKNYKSNIPRYTGYEKKCRELEWKKYRSCNIDVYVHPITKNTYYDYDKNFNPPPVKQYYFESVAPFADIKPVIYTQSRTFEEVKKKIF